MKFKFKPFISFNATTDIGVDEIPLNSYVNIIDSGVGVTKLLYVTSVDTLGPASTVSDLLAATANYTEVLADGVFSQIQAELSSDTTPVLGGDLDGQGNIIDNFVSVNEQSKVINTASLEYGTDPYYVDLDGSNTYYHDMITSAKNITFKLSPTTTIGDSKTITLIIKNDATYTTSFDPGSNVIYWHNNNFPDLELDKTYILEFTKRSTGQWFGRYSHAEFQDGTWDLTHLNTVETSLDVEAQVKGPASLFMSADGVKLYITDSDTANSNIEEWTLSTPWDITSAVYSNAKLSLAAQMSAPTTCYIRSDGKKLYAAAEGAVYQYTLSTPWDITSGTYDTVTLNIGAQTIGVFDIFFKPDGTKMYTQGDSNDLYQYTLSTPWDLSSATYDNVSSTIVGDSNSFFISPDGKKLYSSDNNGDLIQQNTLSKPWDVSFVTFDSITFEILNPATTLPVGVFWKPDGTIMYALQSSTNSLVNQYEII